MIRKLKENDNFDIIEYIGEQYYKCLYLYLDYKKYGVNNDNIQLYVQEESDTVKAILLNYSTSLHIYSRELDCNYEEIFNFIIESKYKAIFAERCFIEKLEKLMFNQYKSEYGNVWKINEMTGIDSSDVERATENDFEKIADLIMTDEDLATSYEYNDLVNQLRERYLQRFGRNYVMRDDGKIIAHVSTNAEIDNVAIVSLLIVDKNYRRRGIAKKLLFKISNDLFKEQKIAYLINYTEESTLLYEKMGLSRCCEWGKLYNVI